MTKAHNVSVLNDTIFLFLSLPENNESPLEINIRRTAFIYSPQLKLQQRVSNQIIHVSDLLPTLVNATNLKWRTRDKIYIDGINQWQALNSNKEERLNVYGDNFYISEFWKLSYGVDNNSTDNDEDFYGSLENDNMESDKDTTEYDFDVYARTLLSSEVHFVLNKLSSQKIMLLKSRAKVHCNLQVLNETAVRYIKCSRSSPCLFELHDDPCEFDNKLEHEFDLQRQHMRDTFERYLRDGKIEDFPTDDKSIVKEDAASTMDDGAVVGIILGATIFVCIFIFIVVVCVKERCNRRRSVYHSKPSKKEKKTMKDESNEKSNGNGSSINGTNDENGISVISRNVK